MTLEGRAPPMLRGERRKQLLAIACQIVSADGLGALTMARLAECANIGKPVVYKHFKNRIQVAISLLEIHFDALMHYFSAKLPKRATFSEYIMATIDASFLFYNASEVPIRNITNGFTPGDEVNRYYLKKDLAARVRWRSIIMALGAPADVGEVAAIIVHGMIGTGIYNFSESSRADGVSRSELATSVIHTMIMASLQAVSGFDTEMADRVFEFDAVT